jgi:hypothetical protein
MITIKLLVVYLPFSDDIISLFRSMLCVKINAFATSLHGCIYAFSSLFISAASRMISLR